MSINPAYLTSVCLGFFIHGVSFWLCGPFCIQITAQVDFCCSCKNSTSLYIWPQMNCTGHPENEKLILKAQLCRDWGSAQVYRVDSVRQQQRWNSASLSTGHGFSYYCPIASGICLPALEKLGWGSAQRRLHTTNSLPGHYLLGLLNKAGLWWTMVKASYSEIFWGQCHYSGYIHITAIECSLLHVCIP